MKKLGLSLIVLLVLLSMAGCSKKEEELPVDEGTESGEVVEVNEEEPEYVVSSYGVSNTTGEKVTELYLYKRDSESKGDNLVPEGLEQGENILLDEETLSFLQPVPADGEESSDIFVLEFVTESGYAGSFTSLNRGVANFELLSADAAAGATQIKFLID